MIIEHIICFTITSNSLCFQCNCSYQLHDLLLKIKCILYFVHIVEVNSKDAMPIHFAPIINLEKQYLHSHTTMLFLICIFPPSHAHSSLLILLPLSLILSDTLQLSIPCITLSPQSAPNSSPLPSPFLPLSTHLHDRAWICGPPRYHIYAVGIFGNFHVSKSLPALTYGYTRGHFFVYWMPSIVRTLLHFRCVGRGVKEAFPSPSLLQMK